MSVEQRTSIGEPPTSRARPAARSDVGTYEDDRGYGWVLFAGIMLMVAGVMNFIYGIAAISGSRFYNTGTHYVIASLNAWGWVVMLLGVLQFCIAMGIWAKAGWARWAGVAIASLNACAQLILLPGYPFLALSIFAIDLLIIYGLVAYGGRAQIAA